MRPARQKFSQRSVFRVDETLYKVIRDPSHHVRCEKKFLYLQILKSPANYETASIHESLQHLSRLN